MDETFKIYSDDDSIFYGIVIKNKNKIIYFTKDKTYAFLRIPVQEEDELKLNSISPCVRCKAITVTIGNLRLCSYLDLYFSYSLCNDNLYYLRYLYDYLPSLYLAKYVRRKSYDNID